MTISEELKKIISSSDLPKEDQEDLKNTLLLLEEKELKLFLNLFKKDIGWVKKISENLKMKRKAFKNQDKELWEKILKQEEEELKKYEDSIKDNDKN